VTAPFAENLLHDAGIDLSLPAVERHAVRAIVRRGGEILMLRASTGAWKFPGGGVESGESDDAALRREIDEECGLAVTSVDDYVGEVVERAAARPGDPASVFVQVSRYYRCSVAEGSGVTALSDAERALGLAAAWVDLGDAVRANRALLGGPHRFVWRELLVPGKLAGRSGWPAPTSRAKARSYGDSGRPGCVPVWSTVNWWPVGVRQWWTPGSGCRCRQPRPCVFTRCS
jgi:8-oxo-dGTP pyrophosphatase MutT (NUDIX family)